MPKLNIIVEHTGACQMAYSMIENCNKLCLDGHASVCCFYEFLQQPCRIKMFPSFNLVGAWAQEGITIATTLQLAQSMIEWPGPSHKIYYIWDIGWLLNPRYVNAYKQYELLHDKNIIIITRCEDHNNIIKNNYNRESDFIFDNFDNKKLLNVIKNLYKEKRL